MRRIAEAARPTPEEVKALRAYEAEQKRLQEELHQERQLRRAEVEPHLEAERKLYVKVFRQWLKAHRANDDADEIAQLSELRARIAGAVLRLEKQRIALLEAEEAHAELADLESRILAQRKCAGMLEALAHGEEAATFLRGQMRSLPYTERLQLRHVLGDKFKEEKSLHILRDGEMLQSPLADATDEQWTASRILEGRLEALEQANRATTLRQRAYFLRLAKYRVVIQSYLRFAGKKGLSAFESGEAKIPSFTQREARKLFRGFGFRGYKPTPQALLDLAEEARQQVARLEELSKFLCRRFQIRKPKREVADATAFAMPLALPEANLPQAEGLCR